MIKHYINRISFYEKKSSLKYYINNEKEYFVIDSYFSPGLITGLSNFGSETAFGKYCVSSQNPFLKSYIAPDLP